MISKVIPNHSFRGSIRYILADNKQATILKVEGVRAHNKTLMIEDFIRQHQLRPEKKQACFHSILSFPHGEDPGNNIITELAERYLEELNITNTQYAIMKHADKKHLHVHIIANMINNNGKSITDKWIGLRGKKVAQQLTRQYRLQPALSKKMKQTHLNNLRPPDKQRYLIYQAIKKNLPLCQSLEELQHRLIQEGINILYKYKGQTTERQGISFQFGEYKFKGSEIDRQYSLSNLEKTLANQQKIKTQTILTARSQERLTQTPLRLKRQHHESFSAEFFKSIGHELAKAIYSITHVPDAADYISPELLREARKKPRVKRNR